jgi:tRNA pseudouridine55 synthase
MPSPPILDSHITANLSFSALKMDGKPLYEYARESKPLPRPIPVREQTVAIELVDFQPAEVVPGDGGHTYTWPEKRLTAEEKEVFSKLTKMVNDAGGEGAEVAKAEEVDLSSAEMPEVSAKTGLRPASFTVRMTVSSGTYVRSIVHDVGVALGFVLHGDEEQLAAIEDVKAAGELAATPKWERVKQQSLIPMTEEELANIAESTTVAETSSSAAPASGPTTGCIPWDVFERAIAEREADIEADRAEMEEAAANMTPAELKANYGRNARIAKSRAGGLKEWETEVLRRFHPVDLPVVRDSRNRAAGNRATGMY